MILYISLIKQQAVDKHLHIVYYKTAKYRSNNSTEQ